MQRKIGRTRHHPLTVGGLALGCPVEPLGDASPGLIPHGPPQLSYLAIARARCTLQLTSVKRDDVGWRIPGSNFKSPIKGSSDTSVPAAAIGSRRLRLHLERRPGRRVSLIHPLPVVSHPTLGLWKTGRSSPERYAYPECGLLWLGGVSACAVAVRDPACATPESVSKVYI